MMGLSCPVCSVSLEPSCQFCPSCGVLLSDVRSDAKAELKLLSVKPVVFLSLTYLVWLPQLAFGFYVGQKVASVLIGHHFSWHTFQGQMLLGLMLIIPALAYGWQRFRNYFKIYHIYAQHLEYQDSFIVKRTEAVAFSRMIEVSLLSPWLKKWYQVGHIRINSYQNTLWLNDIAQADEIFKVIRQNMR